jgi:hypothetical protein
VSYAVEETEAVLGVLADLPAEALSGYLELRATLELTPWGGRPYNPDNPAAANSRTMDFAGGRGLAWYVIIEHEEDSHRRVVVVEVNWMSGI